MGRSLSRELATVAKLNTAGSLEYGCLGLIKRMGILLDYEREKSMYLLGASPMVEYTVHCVASRKGFVLV
jgi:hypothetical protein